MKKWQRARILACWLVEHYIDTPLMSEKVALHLEPDDIKWGEREAHSDHYSRAATGRWATPSELAWMMATDLRQVCLK